MQLDRDGSMPEYALGFLVMIQPCGREQMSVKKRRVVKKSKKMMEEKVYCESAAALLALLLPGEPSWMTQGRDGG